MKEVIRLIKNLIIYLFVTQIGPAVITLLTLAFSIYNWGLGLFAISVTLIMALVTGGTSFIIHYIFRRRKPMIRIMYSSLFAVIVGASIQVYQFSVSTPEDLKSAILVEELMNEFKATNGKLLFIAFEQEI